MSFEKFFQIIDSTPLGSFVARKQALIEATDPQRIYVENIRSFFGVTHSIAAGMCAMAVKRGVFEKRIAVLCPKHKQIIADYGSDESPPPTASCLICEGLGVTVHDYATDSLPRMEFFRLRK